MWKWHCPEDPLLVHEHHTEEAARQSLAAHVLGSEFFGVKDIWDHGVCHLVHEVIDDGVPCDWRNCKIPYRRTGRVIYQSSERR